MWNNPDTGTPLSVEEIERLIQCCNEEIRPIVEVALLTGTRRGELLGLTWEQSGAIIAILKNQDRHPRHIPIHARVEEILKEFKIKNAWDHHMFFSEAMVREWGVSGRPLREPVSVLASKILPSTT